MKIIGLEEHFVTGEVIDAWLRLDPHWRDLALRPATQGEPARLLADLGASRFEAMDETGIDTQVLSLTTPGLQNLAPADAVALQSAVNDELAEAVRAHPDRYQGFAALATPQPDAAAEELVRAVTRLGLNGAMVFGRTRERHLDDPVFSPILEAAQELRAPLYLHPQSPPPEVRAAYYRTADELTTAALSTFGIGWHYDTGVQLLRLIIGGVFDRYPELQVVVGHWGEVVLFYLERIAKIPGLARLDRPLLDYFRTNLYLTPSGMFSRRYLGWAADIVGTDRLLFATDYPFEFAPAGGARAFLEQADLTAADREQFASGTWERLCAGIRRAPLAGRTG
ncbi:amidohydrolase family protein [Sphaerisporangium sp. NPDC051017]|uniref:amidohydrolase family protein n=1 Tax=Sphaerisporangium sp. NPDC051017 TaxID=3154636 RepID=UPI00341F3276